MPVVYISELINFGKNYINIRVFKGVRDIIHPSKILWTNQSSPNKKHETFIRNFNLFTLFKEK